MAANGITQRNGITRCTPRAQHGHNTAQYGHSGRAGRTSRCRTACGRWTWQENNAGNAVHPRVRQQHRYSTYTAHTQHSYSTVTAMSSFRGSVSSTGTAQAQHRHSTDTAQTRHAVQPRVREQHRHSTNTAQTQHRHSTDTAWCGSCRTLAGP